ncbi:MAG: peptidylprolyl isomerase [Pseudomonadota bacterium]
MKRPGDFSQFLRCSFAAFALIISGASSGVAQGQLTPVITVNDRVITAYEIDQRRRLLEVFRTPGNLTTAAREALIEDRLKEQEMARFNVTLSDAGLQAELEAFAARADFTLPQFQRVLSQNGIDIRTLESFVSTGVLWRDYIRSRFGRQITITEADVERARANQGAGPTQLEVLLNEIIIATPPDRPERAARAQDAAEQISRMRSFAAFQDAARQVSALPSRENGGRLDWLPIDNYPPQLRSVILDLETGEVTDPINIPNGIALFQMRGVREARRPQSGPISIDYAAYFIPGGKSPAALQTAEAVRDQIDTCDDLYGVAQGQPAEVLDRVTLPPGEIASDVAIELARLDPGETSVNLTTDNGETLVLLMLCARNQAGAAEADAETIRNQIRSQRLAGLADALLADLRAAANIRQ